MSIFEDIIKSAKNKLHLPKQWLSKKKTPKKPEAPKLKSVFGDLACPQLAKSDKNFLLPIAKKQSASKKTKDKTSSPKIKESQRRDLTACTKKEEKRLFRIKNNFKRHTPAGRYRNTNHRSSETFEAFSKLPELCSDLRLIPYSSSLNFNNSSSDLFYGKNNQKDKRPFAALYPQYEKHVNDAARETGVPALLIWSIMFNESGGDPNAVSSAGAQGLMQLMPGTARELGVRDPFDPRENISAAARYLEKLLNRYQSYPGCHG